MKEQNWVSWKMQTSKTWSDIEEVLEFIKIDFIDHDHKILVEYTLKLNKLIDKSEHSFSLELLEEIKTILKEFYDYAVEHFDREEAFMEQYNLPDIETHKIEHKRILDAVLKSLKDFQNGRLKIGHELRMKVMEWLINHINVTDKEFFEISKWSSNLVDADGWSSVKDIISLTGVLAIDDQHRHLTEQAIELFSTINESSSEAYIQEWFEKFGETIAYHFDYETKFMASYRIKETDEHLKLHQYFIDEVQRLGKELIKDFSKVDEIKVWILSWWIDHINITDQNTFNFINWAPQLIHSASNVDDMKELLVLTQIYSIDYDHIKVMHLTFKLNKLLDNPDDSNPDYKSSVLKLLDQIYKAAEDHFKREEQIMVKHGLKDYASHKGEHTSVLAKLSTIRNNYEENRLHVSKNIKTMILNWWIEHTNNVDYRSFVINLSKEEQDLIRKEEKHV